MAIVWVVLACVLFIAYWFCEMCFLPLPLRAPPSLLSGPPTPTHLCSARCRIPCAAIYGFKVVSFAWGMAPCARRATVGCGVGFAVCAGCSAAFCSATRCPWCCRTSFIRADDAVGIGHWR